MTNVDIQSRWINALRTQPKTNAEVDPQTNTRIDALPCPYPNHPGRIFQTARQLSDHVKAEHNAEVEGIKPEQARKQLETVSLGLKRGLQPNTHQRSTPDIASLSLEPRKRQRPASPPLEGRKQQAPAQDQSTTSEGHLRRSQKQYLDPQLPESRDQTLLADNRPISAEQFTSEVESIYDGLTMVDAEVTNRKLKKLPSKLAPGLDDFASKTIFEIPGILAGEHAVDALGDTGATYNFMREEYALKPGFSIQRDNTCSVTITKGHHVTTTGTAEVIFNFAGDEEQHSILFHLLPDCIHDVILGNAFLKATKTLTSFVSRIKKRVVENTSLYHFLFLGESAPRFTGYLNGRPQEAVADTGAKVLVMDEDYAQSIGLRIDPKRKVKLRFGDNSTAFTSGMTRRVEWEFGYSSTEMREYEENEDEENEDYDHINQNPPDEDDSQWQPLPSDEMYKGRYLLDFHIMKNAPANVILSDEFLFRTNAFSEYECFLLEEQTKDDNAHLFVIDRDMNHVSKVAALSAAVRQHREDVRRGEEADRIAELPEAEQVAAQNAENERQARWDAQQISANVPPDPLGHGTSNATQPNNGIGTGNGSATKQRWWCFKFKRRKPPGL